MALSGTLIIGAVLGALIAFSVVRKRVDRFKKLQRSQIFTETLIQAANPSATQEARIRPIIEEFGEKMEAMHMRHREEHKAEMVALREALKNHLTQDQMKAVRKQLRKLRGKREKGPPPPRRPR